MRSQTKQFPLSPATGSRHLARWFLVLAACVFLLLPTASRSEIYTYTGRMDGNFTVTDALTINIPSDNIVSFTYNYPLPQNVDYKINKQAVANLQYSFSTTPTTAEIKTSDSGSTYLFLHWAVSKALNITGTVSYDVTASADWEAFNTDDAYPLPPASIPESVSNYLQATSQVQSDDTAITTLAATLIQGITTEHEAVTALVGWIIENVDYGANPKGINYIDALSTLAPDAENHRSGICSNFSHLALALLRAAGIPARYVSGVALSKPYNLPYDHGGTITGIDWAPGPHAWIEVYYPSLGWVDYDAQRDLHHVDIRRINQGVSSEDKTRPGGSVNWSFVWQAPPPSYISSLNSSPETAVVWTQADNAVNNLAFASTSRAIPDKIVFALQPNVNTRPVAAAGADRAAFVGSQLALSGSVIDSDPDNSWTYAWTVTQKPSGAQVSLSGDNTASPTFQADKAGTYVVSLVITDNHGAASEADTLVITLTDLITLTGTITATEGQVPAGLIVMATEEGGGRLWQTIADSVGTFSFNLPMGVRISLTVSDAQGRRLGGGWVNSGTGDGGVLEGTADPDATGTVLAITSARTLRLALPPSRTIAGQVTTAGGMVVAEVMVEARSATAGSFVTTTDKDGYYRLAVKPNTDYRVEVNGGGSLIPSFYGGRTWAEARVLDVTAVSVTDVDIILDSGLTISGTVTGLPAAKELVVEAWSEVMQAWSGILLTGTGAGLAYTLTGLPVGSDYVIHFHGSGQQEGYLQADGSGGAWATARQVSAGEGNIAITLTPGARISGTIIGLPAGVKAELTATSAATGNWGSTLVTGSGSGADGYTITGLPALGDYLVALAASGFLAGYWNGTPGTSVTPVAHHRATAIDATAGAVAGIHFTMTPGATIGGTVTGLAAGELLFITALSKNNAGAIMTIVTGAGGGSDPYTLAGLVSGGLYTLNVEGGGHPGGFYSTAGLVTASGATEVAAGVNGITIALSMGKRIAGIITGLTSDERVVISAWSATSGSWGDTIVLGTGNDQPYTITGLAAADDFVVTIEPARHGVQRREGVSSRLNPSNNHFSLSAGAAITGTVTVTAGTRQAVTVSAVSADTGGASRLVTVVTSTGGVAVYTLSGLPVGSGYVVSAAAGNLVGYYDAALLPGAAKPVTVPAGGVSGIDINLSALAATLQTISGTVAGIGSDDQVTISAWAAGSGVSMTTSRTGNGDFSLKVPPGIYRVGFYGRGFRDSFYGGLDQAVTDYGQAATLDVRSGTGATGVMTLMTGSSLSGVVFIDANGSGQPDAGEGADGAMVEAVGSNTGTLASIAVGADGRYRFNGLPDDSYALLIRLGDKSAAQNVTLAGTGLVVNLAVK